MNPYVTNPDDIPPNYLYADVPLYGRYCPRPGEFCVDTQHTSTKLPSTGSIQYWESVIDLCTESVKTYPADEGGRDVFALGNVIVKSSHLHEKQEKEYAFADANEITALTLAKSKLEEIGVNVPEIYFAGKIRNRQVLVQQRLPGVTLAVAWPYLFQHQKESFKIQARQLLARLHSIKQRKKHQTRSHIIQDPNILHSDRLNPLEVDIIFSDKNTDPDKSFMHNDTTPSNVIVDEDKITGLIDWEMAGWFGWNTAGEVHRRIRTPQREHFANAGLSEETLQDMMFWNDLYDEGAPEN